MAIGRSAFWIALALASCQLACAGPGPIHETPMAALRRDIARDVPSLERHEVVIPHELSDRSLEQVHAILPKLDEERRGAHGLIDLLFGADFLGLTYQWATVRDANQTLSAGGGNCLSLGAVVVAIARAHGGAARYVEIDTPLEEEQLGDLGVVATHIGVMVPSRDGPLIVDFRGRRLAADVHIRLLSDRDAVAHYYNDRGYELIWQARRTGGSPPWREARQHFATATQVAPQLGAAWNNLGVANARLGEYDAAEAAYTEARRHSAWGLEAATVANLASLESRRSEVPAPPPGR